MESLARLGIDFWSLLLYSVNFGLVVLLVAKFLTKPILKVLDDRKGQIEKNVEEAEKLREEMARYQGQMERERHDMQAKLHEELTKSKKEIEERRKLAEVEIEAKRVKMLADVKVVIDSEKRNIIDNAQSEVLALMQKVILHIVSNKIPENLVKESVTESWMKYKS